MSSKKVNSEAKAAELDVTREILADPRDPRSAGCWPCFKNHNGCVKGSNKFGAWTMCSVCNLKLSYIPRMGSPAKFMEQVDHTHVQKALNKLQIDLNGMKPNHLRVKTAVDLMGLQEKYNLEVTGIKESPPSPAPQPKARPSQASQAVGYSLPQQDLLAALTPEERLALENRLHQAQPPAESVISMNPNDEWDIQGN